MKASTDGMKKEKKKERKKERNPTTQQDAITLLNNELLLACMSVQNLYAHGNLRGCGARLCAA